MNAPVSTIGNVVSTDTIVVVPVRVKNFVNVAACNIKIGFDSTIVRLIRVTQGPGLSPTGGLNFNATLPGEVYFQWYGNPSVSMADDGVAFQLHFRRVAPGYSPVYFIQNEKQFHCTYTHFPSWDYFDDDPKADYFKDGSVTFITQRSAPVTTIPSVTASAGQKVVLPVTVTGFNNVGAASFIIRYDQNVLTDPQFSNTSNTIPFGFKTNTPGMVTLSGQSTASGGHSLSDGAVLFTLTFSYLGGTSLISFDHTYAVNCQYGGPPPLFPPLEDYPKELFFIDGSVSMPEPPEVKCPGDISVCCKDGPVHLAGLEGVSPGGGVFTMRGEPIEEFVPDCSQTGNFVITYSYSDPVSLIGNSCSFTITVNDDFTPGEIASAGETIGYNEIPEETIGSVVNASGGNGEISYQWQKSIVSASEGFFDIPLATAPFFAPTDTLVQTAWFRRLARDRMCSPEWKVSDGIWEVTVLMVVQGTFSYLNKSLSPLENVKVGLKKGDSILFSTTTGEDGHYAFPLVKPGDYQVVASLEAPAGAAINALDAGMVNLWGTIPSFELEKVRFMAGDVEFNRFLDAADASRINNSFLTGGDPAWKAPVGVWMFWKAGDRLSRNRFDEDLYPSVTVGKVPVVQDFYGLITGDFDMSYSPELKTAGFGNSVVISDGSVISAVPGSEMVIPVKAASGMKVGAISLILDFPFDKVEISDVFLGNGASPVPWKVVNNQLRIGWFSNDPADIRKDSTLLGIKVKVKPGDFTGQQIRFTLTNNVLNGLGDEEMHLIDRAELFADVLKIVATAVPDEYGSHPFTFQVFPNPADRFLTLRYVVPEKGMVSVNAWDLTGRKIAIITDEIRQAGVYDLRVSVMDWVPGLYFVDLRLINSQKAVSGSKKIMIK